MMIVKRSQLFKRISIRNQRILLWQRRAVGYFKFYNIIVLKSGKMEGRAYIVI